MSQKNEDDLRAARERASREAMEQVNALPTAPLYRTEQPAAEPKKETP